MQGACEGLPCSGCQKLPMPAVFVHLNGGRDTCALGNYPGIYRIQEHVCGIHNLDPVIFGPEFGTDFKKDAPQVTWHSGSVVDVQVKYLANHAGNYQFRLCLDGSDTDECFKQTPLVFEDGQDWHWIDAGWMALGELRSVVTGKLLTDRIVIPDGIECEHCTLNWRWDTSLEASVLSNCADVAIKKPSHGDVSSNSSRLLEVPNKTFAEPRVI
jgi:hypothetical protein